MIDTQYSFGGTSAAPRALYAFAMPLVSRIKVGGVARLSGEQSGLSSLDFGLTLDSVTARLRNALVAGIGARDLSLELTAKKTLSSTVTAAIRSSDSKADIALLHDVTPNFAMRYRADLEAMRGGVATSYNLSPAIRFVLCTSALDDVFCIVY